MFPSVQGAFALEASPIEVTFHGAVLLVVEHAGQPYIPMKPVVEGMGMDWASQFIKLKSSRFNSTIAEITMIASDGKKRALTCLPLRKLPGWMMTISPNKNREGKYQFSSGAALGSAPTS